MTPLQLTSQHDAWPYLAVWDAGTCGLWLNGHLLKQKGDQGLGGTSYLQIPVPPKIDLRIL